MQREVRVQLRQPELQTTQHAEQQIKGEGEGRGGEGEKGGGQNPNAARGHLAWP
jgi:hypothetical protein